MAKKSTTRAPRASTRSSGTSSRTPQSERFAAGAPMRAEGGERTTVRIPGDLRPAIESLRTRGQSQGAAIQTLLRMGAEALERERAEERARRALAVALDAPAQAVPGLPSAEDVERAIQLAREE